MQPFSGGVFDYLYEEYQASPVFQTVVFIFVARSHAEMVRFNLLLLLNDALASPSY